MTKAELAKVELLLRKIDERTEDDPELGRNLVVRHEIRRMFPESTPKTDFPTTSQKNSNSIQEE